MEAHQLEINDGEAELAEMRSKADRQMKKLKLQREDLEKEMENKLRSSMTRIEGEYTILSKILFHIFILYHKCIIFYLFIIIL